MSKQPTLKQSKEIVSQCIDKTRAKFSISIVAEPYEEHIKIRGRRIDLFSSDIIQIEEKTGFHLHGMTYWNEPDFMKKWPAMPKYMRDYTKGDHVEIRFVRVKKP
jgi:hypothetical protein